MQTVIIQEIYNHYSLHDLICPDFLQVSILAVGKDLDLHRCGNSSGPFCANAAGANSVLCHDSQCSVVYNVTTSRARHPKATPVTIKDAWPIFYFSRAPKITRRLRKCAKCYASFLTFHLQAPLPFFPTGQLQVTSRPHSLLERLVLQRI